MPMPKLSVQEVKAELDTHEAVCAERWKEAYDFGKAPKLFLKKSNKKALTIIKIEILKKFSLDLS